MTEPPTGPDDPQPPTVPTSAQAGPHEHRTIARPGSSTPPVSPTSAAASSPPLFGRFGRYELLANTANPAEFTFVEEWADQAAIDAHMATPHLKAVVANTQPPLVEPLDVRFYTLA